MADQPDQPVENLQIAEDFLMAYRYSYYVHSRSLIPDQEYDKLEREFLAKSPPSTSPIYCVGSSNETSYHPAHRALALYISLRFCKRAHDDKPAKEER